jgi:hypothetical protein
VETTQTSAQKLTFWTMTAMVVGSMVGAGVFSLPRRFAQETGINGALVAWVIAGTGMLMLAFVFQTLAVRKPELDAGVYAYAKAGFGDYLGFFSAFGYWASACVGNVTYWVLIMSTLGAIAPALGEGDTLLAAALSTVGAWVFYLLIRRGVKDAAILNRIVTVAKVIPILVFVLLALFALDPQVFADKLRGGDYGSLFDQVRGTMLVTVFVFLGVEGASVYSRHAERREDVGRATVLGFLAVFAVFASVTRVVRNPAVPRARRAAPALHGRRSRGGRRRFGQRVRQCRPDRLGARRISRLDLDGGRGAVRRGEGRRHAAVPQAGQHRDRRSDRRSADVDRAGPDHARRHDVLRGRVQLRARSHQRADAHPVAAVRRRTEVHPGVDDHLRAGVRACS